MSSEPVILARQLSKRYEVYAHPQDRLKQLLLGRRKAYFKEFWALRDLDLTVRRGETIGIIGRNGSGKSTLLQILCGTLKATSGTIQRSGRIAALLELGSGFNPEFTGRENVFLNASLLGLKEAQIRERFDRIVAFSELENFIDQPVKTYSSGMFVRLAFSVVAHVDADVLIIDEALAVGDVFFSQKCMRFLREFRERGTVIFVSHDTGAVLNLCHRAVWLDAGIKRAEGEAREVCELYHQAFYEAQQGASFIAGDKRKRIATEHDIRKEEIDRSTLRNDIQVFRFHPDGWAFGAGGARIAGIRFLDAEHGQALATVVGGEIATVEIAVDVLAPLPRPIIGFAVKDRLGQTLFGDNTYITYRAQPVAADPDSRLLARFTFRMPILPAGEYVVSAAVADGTQSEHIQHHWCHEGLAIRSLSSSVSTGLVGIPMLDIRLSAEASEPSALLQ